MLDMPKLPERLNRTDIIERSWVVTLSGKRFNILSPNPDDIVLSDIASSLARQARFNGHTRFFYSVGQHSCLGAMSVLSGYKTTANVGERPSNQTTSVKENSVHSRKSLARDLLFHDATETYLGDLVSPVKRLLPDFEVIEDRIFWAIAKRFDLSYPAPKEVKAIDRKLLATEVRDLITKDLSSWSIQHNEPFEETVIPWPVEVAESKFLELAQLR